MNTKHLLITSLTGGLISTVLVNTPFLNWINLLICAGFWIGPIAAVWLYRRQEGTLTLSQAMLIGMLAGLWHGLFGVLLRHRDRADRSRRVDIQPGRHADRRLLWLHRWPDRGRVLRSTARDRLICGGV